VFHCWQGTGVLLPVGKHSTGHLMTQPASFLHPVFPWWVAAYIKNANLVSILPSMIEFSCCARQKQHPLRSSREEDRRCAGFIGVRVPILNFLGYEDAGHDLPAGIHLPEIDTKRTHTVEYPWTQVKWSPSISKTVELLWRWTRILDSRSHFRTHCGGVLLWPPSGVLGCWSAGRLRCQVL